LTEDLAVAFPTLSVAIVAPDAAVRARIAAVLAGRGVDVIADAPDAEQLLADANGRAPDAVVVACDRLGTREVASIRRLRAELDGSAIVGVARSADRASVSKFVREGVQCRPPDGRAWQWP
jgi:DNA-binding NarL/FixJ family response regulator